MSVGELAITRRISLVAVCCSNASVRTRLRLQLLEQPHVLDGDHRLVREGRHQLDLPLCKWHDTFRAKLRLFQSLSPHNQGTRNERACPSRRSKIPKTSTFGTWMGLRSRNAHPEYLDLAQLGPFGFCHPFGPVAISDPQQEPFIRLTNMTMLRPRSLTAFARTVSSTGWSSVGEDA